MLLKNVMSKNKRAYELLRWQALAPLAEYDETIDYFSIWKKYSDKALDDWDEKHPYEPSDELKAFKKLEAMGIFTQQDFFSPTQAKEHSAYTRKLKSVIRSTSDAKAHGVAEEARSTSHSDGTGERPPAANAQQGRRAGRRLRRERQRFAAVPRSSRVDP